MWNFEDQSETAIGSDFLERRKRQRNMSEQPLSLIPPRSNRRDANSSRDRNRNADTRRKRRNRPAPQHPNSPLRALDSARSALNLSPKPSTFSRPLEQLPKKGQGSRRERRRSEPVIPFQTAATRRVRPEPRALSPRKETPIALPRPRTRSGVALLYGARLLILGIGVGVIAGTILSIWDPAIRTAGAQAESTEQPTVAASPEPTLPPLTLTPDKELIALKTQLQAAIAPQTQFTPGLMVVDLDTQSYVDINGSTEFSAASTIKFPILVAFFQDVDAGKIRLDEMLTMRKELIATEAGYMQYQPVGTQFPALEVATKMIIESDNTATNMIIDRLGGNEAITQRFQSWGLTQTALRNPLPDLPGTNVSSPKDMVTLFNQVSSGKMMSVRALERMLDIMRRVKNNSLLPQGLGQGATIAHKTGDIGTMLGDVGMVDMPNGKRYLIAAMVKRPHNDDRAYDLINQMSKLTYQHLSQGATSDTNPANSVPASPAPGNPQGAEPQQRSTIAQP